MAGFKQEQDDAYCNAPVRHVEDVSNKAVDAEVHEGSGWLVAKRSIEYVVHPAA